MLKLPTDHGVRAIQTLNRRNRTARKAILAVVVVLEDPRAAATAHSKSASCVDRHGGAERELVCGRDIDQSRLPALPLCQRNVETVLVDRRRHQVRPEAGEHRGNHRVTRILEAHRITGVDHETGGQIQSVLNARHDDHLIRRATHTPRRAQIIGDGLS